MPKIAKMIPHRNGAAPAEWDRGLTPAAVQKYGKLLRRLGRRLRKTSIELTQIDGQLAQIDGQLTQIKH